MFMRIVLPLDLTERHDPALTFAAELVDPEEGEVLLLHVIEVIPGLSLEEERPFYDRLELTARGHLAKFADQLGERGISCRQKVCFGARALEIAGYATEVNADLIVLTAPLVEPDRPAVGWGSVSYKVGLLARCPVLLVK